MKNEVHIYLGSSTATEKANGNYLVGNIHPFLLLIKYDSNTDYIHADVNNCLKGLGWENTALYKSGKLYKTPTNEDFIAPYNQAIKQGSAIVIYNDPIKE